MVDPLMLEVDDELRRERMQKLWQRFGQYVVGLSIAIVFVTAAIVGWKSYQNAQNEGWTAELLTAQKLIASPKPLEAMEVLEPLMESASPKISTLARLWSVQLLAKHGKREDAKALADAASLGDIAEPYRDILALYQTVLGSNNAEALEDSNFVGLMKEAEAINILEKDEAAARKLLSSIETDALTSPALKERAMLVSSTLESK